jgi:hypothetical protein
LRRRLLLPLCLAGALALAWAAPAGAAEKSIWGPTPDFPAGNQNCPTPAPCSAFPTYAQLGVQDVQLQIPWDRVALTRPANPRDPNDPAYTWPSYGDVMVQQAAQYGMSLTVLVQGTPGWANGDKGREWVPDNVQDYADFMYAISRRYPSIHRWMIWGEVNFGANFQPMPAHSPVGPRAYASLLDTAYVALKAASPANIVIGGDTLNVDTPVSLGEFIRWARVGKGRKKRPPRLDWWGHNPYEGRFPNLALNPVRKFLGLSDADTIHKLLKRAYVGKPKKKKRRKGKGKRKVRSAAHFSKSAHHHAKKKGKKKKKHRRVTPPLWFSEYSVLSGHAAHLWHGFHVSEEEQAAWLAAAYQTVAGLPYVEGLGWYRLDDEPDTFPLSADWGLVRYTGAQKLSFAAYQAAP